MAWADVENFQPGPQLVNGAGQTFQHVGDLLTSNLTIIRELLIRAILD